MLIQLLILLLIAGICGALGQAIPAIHTEAAWFRSRSDLSVRFWDRGSRERFTCRSCSRLMWRACIFRSSGPSSAQRCSWR